MKDNVIAITVFPLHLCDAESDMICDQLAPSSPGLLHTVLARQQAGSVSL